MIYVITGPTCLGKTDTAINIAKALDAEIINGDAFQCYKELNIGVAKPTNEQLLAVKSHLFSFVDPSYFYTIKDYQENMRNTINGINKDIVIVGGSGLYIKSALYDYTFSEDKEVDMSKYESMDNSSLHDYLKTIDSKQAELIHVNNRKRLLRAIKIYLSEGKTKSEIIDAQEHKPLYDVRFFVRKMDRELLYERINKRVDIMMEQGLVNEVKYLYGKYGDKTNSLQAIGYKEIIQYLKNEINLEKAVDLIKQHTRNYAKRQLTFIAHQFNVEYYENDKQLLEMIKNG